MRSPLLLVLVGGMIGGAARIGLDALIPAGTHGLPWDLLAINVAGSAALGWLDGRIEVRGTVWWQPLVGTGMLGGFTTFSSIAALTWTADAGAGLALVVLAATLVVTVTTAVATRRLAIARGAA
ncbi:CrcB family protein [Demequina sp. NBRC 110057]|uniref:FluC/FEX family fluoride channel n=1 Tax=Demequina sp. NBRC 110057 TaxID=1570346 RepID=UPI0009FBD9D9|nr:CrcB family protein [Demequina sp. NBRC 110057]